MHTITLVTGNAGKLREWQRMFPADWQLEAVDADLDEIQELDLEKLVADKARRAFAVVGKPVIVEDISAGLDNLGDLPGPFIKFFEKRLGRDALYRLADQEGDRATVKCAVAYYDGEQLITELAEVKGSVCPTRGENGFGFDKVFVPAGQSKTYGEMTAAEKDAISHRSKAIRQLVQRLQSLEA